MARKSSKKKTRPDFRYLEKQHADMLRVHRQVIMFNRKELDAIEEYCRKSNVTSKSALYRTIIMEHILESLDELHPKLF